MYQSKLLSHAKVDIISLIQTSASLFEDNYDARIKSMIVEASGLPATTSAEGIGFAIHALKLNKVALVSPYSDYVVLRAKRYYESNFDLEVIKTVAFGATDAYAIGILDPSHALEAFKRVDRPNIDA